MAPSTLAAPGATTTIRRPISRIVQPCARNSAISSRSGSDKYLPERGCADGPNIAGRMPPAFLNHRAPTACGTPAVAAASSLTKPAEIAAQNLLICSRFATVGRPGDRKAARLERSDCRFHLFIAALSRRCDDHLNSPNLPPIGDIDCLVWLAPGMRGREGLVARRMPVLREH